MSDKKIILVSNSRLSYIRKCARMANYKLLMDLKPKNEDMTARDMGSAIHKVLAKFYGESDENKRYSANFISECMDFARFLGSNNYKFAPEVVELIARVFEAYAIYYTGRDNFKVLGIEKPFIFDLYEDDEFIVKYEGQKDMVIEKDDMTIVFDHKTSSRDSMPAQLSPQFIGYTYNEDTKYLTVNRILMKLDKPDKMFKRQPYIYGQDFWKEWRDATIYKIKEFTRFIKANYFPPNHESCTVYGQPACQFYNVCSLPMNLRIDEVENNYTNEAIDEVEW